MGARELREMGVKCSWGVGMGEPDGGKKWGQCSDGGPDGGYSPKMGGGEETYGMPWQ